MNTTEAHSYLKLTCFCHKSICHKSLLAFQAMVSYQSSANSRSKYFFYCYPISRHFMREHFCYVLQKSARFYGTCIYMELRDETWLAMLFLAHLYLCEWGGGWVRIYLPLRSWFEQMSIPVRIIVRSFSCVQPLLRMIILWSWLLTSWLDCFLFSFVNPSSHTNSPLCVIL